MLLHSMSLCQCPNFSSNCVPSYCPTKFEAQASDLSYLDMRQLVPSGLLELAKQTQVVITYLSCVIHQLAAANILPAFASNNTLAWG